MQPRIDYPTVAPEVRTIMRGLEQYVHQAGLDPKLLELVKLRASLINGCAYCIDMHTKDARANGESEQRLYALPAWRETPYFSEPEQAALALTEAMTRLSERGVPDDVFDRAARAFTQVELAQLISVIVTINAWNRIGVTTRAWEPGSYDA